ncbi:hypothetical protein AAK913_12560 [Enterococcus faecium]|uniref:hypothetical protein n=1 Tax=Enterococcus faecium TaxID=1352 RepID=UPI003512B549
MIKLRNNLKRLFKSKIVVLLAIISFWTIGSKLQTVDAYSFGSVYQHYLLGTKSKTITDEAGDQKVVMNLGSLGSGGVSGEFSYDEIVNSADTDENKEDAKKFVSMMATYSTFNYFSNKVEGFSAIIPYFGRALSGIVLLPLALMMDILALIIPTLVGLIAKMNVIRLLATVIENQKFTSDLADVLGITPEMIAKWTGTFLGIAVGSILITFAAVFSADRSINQRNVSKLKGKLFSIVCLPLVIGITASFLDQMIDFSMSADSSSGSFSRYLIDDRSWAYNFNFAPNGNDSEDGGITATNAGSYVDLNFNPYQSKAEARIKKINAHSSLMNDDDLFSNSSLVLAYMSSASFSATDYINYKGSEASNRFYGSSDGEGATIGSYYDYANKMNVVAGDNKTNKLVDVDHSYVPSKGNIRENNTDKMQEGGYSAAIDDYRSGDDLKVKPQIAWRDRYIYGVKNSGEHIDKFYGVSPSLEQIENEVGTDGAGQYGIATQSMYLLLSTIFDETGGRYYIDAPARGVMATKASFDSNRSSYYVVSMVGEAYFTIFGLVSIPLIQLVVLMAVLTAVFSIGIIDMNLKPLSAWSKAFMIGDFEYSMAFIIYGLGIGGTIITLVVIPNLLGKAIRAIGGLITLPASFLDITALSPQASLSLEGIKLIFTAAVAIFFAFLYWKSPTFRARLIDLFSMPWSYASAKGERLEMQASGGLSRRAKTERDRIRARNRLNTALDDANRTNSSSIGAVKNWFNDTVGGVRNDLGRNRPSNDDEVLSTDNQTVDNGTTTRTNSPEDIARAGKKERIGNSLKELAESKDVSPSVRAGVSDAEDYLNEFYKEPTPESFNKAYTQLDMLQDQIKSEDEIDEESLQNVLEAKEELTSLAKDYELHGEASSSDIKKKTSTSTKDPQANKKQDKDLDEDNEANENEGDGQQNNSFHENTGSSKSDEIQKEPSYSTDEPTVLIAPGKGQENSIKENSSQNNETSREIEPSSEHQQVSDTHENVHLEQPKTTVVSSKEYKSDSEKLIRESETERIEKNSGPPKENIVERRTKKEFNNPKISAWKQSDSRPSRTTEVKNKTNIQKKTETVRNETIRNQNDSYSTEYKDIGGNHSAQEFTRVEVQNLTNSLGKAAKNEHVDKVLNEINQSESPKDLASSIEKMKYSFKLLSQEERDGIDREEFSNSINGLIEKNKKVKKNKNKKRRK